MGNRMRLIAGLLALVSAQATVAQSTGLPSFNAPHRPFSDKEFGGAVSFVQGGTGVEGQFGIGLQKIDIGFRGGIFDPDFGDAAVLLGATGRAPVLQHSEEVPVDAAVVVGIGAVLNDNANVVVIPGGLSVGRRFDVDPDLSVLIYGQPTLFLTTGDPGTDLNFAFGFGGDLRIKQNIDIRVGVGVGDIEGVTLALVFVR